MSVIPDYDSILHATDSNVIIRSEYYATGKGLPDHGIAMVERPYNVNSDDNILYGLIFMFIIIAATIYRSSQIMAHRIKTFFTTKRVYSDINVNDNSNEIIGILLLTIVCAISQGIIAYNCLSKEFLFPTYLDKPYWIIGFTSLLFGFHIYVRAIVYSCTNWIFFDKEERKRWNSGYWLSISILAYIFYVLSIVSIFYYLSTKIVILCSLFIYILYEIILLYKMIVNFRIKNYGTFLIFLYFCTVEILPLMLIWHLFEWVFNSDFVKNLLT